jgi:hypothetical protein
MRVLKTKSNKLFTEKDYVPLELLTDLQELELRDEALVYRIEHQDFVAQVPAAITLGDFDRDLLEFGLYSRIWGPAHYSLSRILAENWGNDLYKQVLGLQLMDINGIETKTGGKVIKNVSGYDLAKIYLGSRNSLALIRHACLKVEKKPESQSELLIEFDVDDALKLINQQSLSELYEITTSNFDDSLELSILSSKLKEDLFNIKLAMRLTAREALLDLRTKKLLTKLLEFFRNKNIGVDLHDQLDFKKIPFQKKYPADDLRIEFHTNLANLANIYKKLLRAFGESIVIYPKHSRIDFHAGALGLEDLAFQVNNILATDGLGPVYLRVFPVNALNLHLERKLNNPVNKFEEESTRKLKNSFDSLNLLNPDILVGAVIDA